VSYGGYAIIIIALTGAALFFSVNLVALRRLSRVKLLDAFKARAKEEVAGALTDRIAAKAEDLVLACALYRFVLNMAILLLLILLFERTHPGRLQAGHYVAALIIATAIFSVFNLAIPNAWAKYAGEKSISRVHRTLFVLARIASPVLAVVKACDGLVRRLAGVPQSTPDKRQEEKQEEFLSGLEQRRMEGVVDEEEQEMIENVLKLSETTAGEIMTPRTDIVAVELNSNLNDVVRTITGAGHTRVPVYKENIDNIIGLVYAKDLLAEIGKVNDDFNLQDKMRQAYFVPETKDLRALLHEFQNQKLHISVVLDEYGGTAGIVTLEDILEELVGEITDEYEKTPPEPIHRIDDNTFEVDARTHVDDLNDEFELNLPEDEDYDTIGGFVFSHLGYIPKTGESFDYANLKFTITSAGPRKVNRVRVRKIVHSEA